MQYLKQFGDGNTPRLPARNRSNLEDEVLVTKSSGWKQIFIFDFESQL